MALSVSRRCPDLSDALPYFFSDQYESGMGIPRPGGPGTAWTSGDIRTAGSRVLAGMEVDVCDVGDDIERLIRSRPQVDAERLADVELPLAQVSARPVDAKPDPTGAPNRGFLAEGMGFVRTFVADRFTPADPTLVEQLAPGEGRALDVAGEKVAGTR